jgi:aspartyl-tRNA synthetase
VVVIAVDKQGNLSAPIAKHLSDDEKASIISQLKLNPDDLVLMCAGKEADVLNSLGRLRRICIDEMMQNADFDRLTKGIPAWEIMWVERFPLFEKSKEGNITSTHHPFTAPTPETKHLLDTDPLKVRKHSQFFLKKFKIYLKSFLRCFVASKHTELVFLIRCQLGISNSGV